MRAIGVILLTLCTALAAAPASAKQRALRAFPSCTALLDYARSHGVTAIKTGWAPSPMTLEGPRPVSVPPSGAKGEAAPQAATQDSMGAGTGESYSTTNVQEAGVDEPDLVKTDGKTIYALANGVLHAVDATGDTPVLVGTVTLDEGYGHQLMLRGDKLLVIQSAWLETEARQTPDQSSSVAPDFLPSGRVVTRMTEIDVSDPAAMQVLRRERDDGEFVSARMTGATVRVVLASRAPVMYAVAAVSGASEKQIVGKRLRRVRRASIAAWRPHRFFRDEAKPKRARFGPLTKCGQMRRTARFSGLDTITILTVDMNEGLPSVDADAIMSDAQIVYGSPDRLFVATQRWLSPAAMQRSEPPATTTQIHQFDASEPGRTAYVTSGQVKGFLLNQFAMSQHGNVLRVAATETPEWWGGGSQAGEGSAVSTLSLSTMGELGRVGGLGKGERIYAVRFLGDTGYVVTFRQVDPLYVVDLSDPADPRVRGELKIAGYSAYLHPVSEDLILGVGQDAGEDGRTTGTQLSLFDVSDPAKPTRVAQHAIANSSSTAEYDHHAFLYWPKTKLAVIPLTLYDYTGREDGTYADPFVGAVGFRVERSGIAEVGRISHPPDEYALWDVQRATVIGERLFTLSAAGMMASPLATLGNGTFAGFPSKPVYTGGDCGYATDGGTQTDIACPMVGG